MSSEIHYRNNLFLLINKFIIAVLPYSTYISQFFNFVNFANLESFTKLFHKKILHFEIEPHWAAQLQNYFNEIKIIAIRDNLEPQNISAIRYIQNGFTMLVPSVKAPQCSQCSKMYTRHYRLNEHLICLLLRNPTLEEGGGWKYRMGHSPHE